MPRTTTVHAVTTIGIDMGKNTRRQQTAFGSQSPTKQIVHRSAAHFSQLVTSAPPRRARLFPMPKHVLRPLASHRTQSHRIGNKVETKRWSDP